mgnify:CR=1 FL=1
MDNKASAARFLLGGIGTGTISLDQNARLCDYEIWNLPNKGFRLPYNFFAVRAESPDGQVNVKALESQLAPPFNKSHGYHAWQIGGLPRFRHSEMTGDYPFVRFTLTDESMPVKAKLEAFTPFIPLATDDSSLPAAVLRYTICNTGEEDLMVSVAGSMPNMSTFKGSDIWTKPLFEGRQTTEYIDQGNSRGLHFYPAEKTEADPDYFESALMTTETDEVTYLDKWNEGAWWDGIQDFWNDFTEDGSLTPGRMLHGKGNSVHKSNIPMASLCIKKNIPAGESADFPFILAWYRPNRVRSWDQMKLPSVQHPIIRNYYAKFGPPLQVVKGFVNRLPELEEKSRTFTRALRASTVPEYVIDAVSAALTVIRSNTCWRVEDGTFFAWEGNFDHQGCCEGNCTHVWGYTQTLAFLFPDLERSMRRTEFLTETNDDGRMCFRALRYLHDGSFDMPPAADGQLDAITRLYRDWKLCGDDTFLKEVWPKAKSALDYACTQWDNDGDGVMNGQQHNTYDIEFYGVSSMINSIFYAALRCGEEICHYLGDDENADRYAGLYKTGAEKLDALTFNGEYYQQVIDNVNEQKYQYGKGCLSDQLLGQQLAHVNKLGYLLPEDHVKSAVQSIYKYNFREDFGGLVKLQRTYALNDDQGLLLCSWPHGGRPEIPFVYCDEVWTGVEYQVASHLIYEGFVDEGLRIVKACRDRHDGVERSPWDEVECGHHYARSLASYGVLLAFSGFFCDAVNKTLTFKPAVGEENFKCFFCCADGWGIYHQAKNAAGGLQKKIETLYGDLSAYTLA